MLHIPLIPMAESGVFSSRYLVLSELNTAKRILYPVNVLPKYPVSEDSVHVSTVLGNLVPRSLKATITLNC